MNMSEDFKLKGLTFQPGAKIIVDGKKGTKKQLVGKTETVIDKSLEIMKKSGYCEITTPAKEVKVATCPDGIITIRRTPTNLKMDVVEFGPNATSRTYYSDLDAAKNTAKVGCKEQDGKVCK